jgi:hypothetical protein
MHCNSVSCDLSALAGPWGNGLFRVDSELVHYTFVLLFISECFNGFYSRSPLCRHEACKCSGNNQH